MLRVSIHTGSLATMSRFNRVAWLDIGYEKLAPIADYKVVLYQNGIGATLPTPIYSYPRWSASLWDLAARGIALSLRTDMDCLNEEVPPLVHTKKRFAFASALCATIDHAPSTGQHRRTLAQVAIKQVGRSRGTYTARFEEHAMSSLTAAPFEFHPDFLRPVELLLHACLVRLTGAQKLPPRPALCVPQPLEKDGKRFVPIHRLVEPARTGFLRWLHHSDNPPLEHPGAPAGIAPEALYARFLKDAV